MTKYRIWYTRKVRKISNPGLSKAKVMRKQLLTLIWDIHSNWLPETDPDGEFVKIELVEGFSEDLP